jgi:hypothetical protein
LIAFFVPYYLKIAINIKNIDSGDWGDAGDWGDVGDWGDSPFTSLLTIIKSPPRPPEPFFGIKLFRFNQLMGGLCEKLKSPPESPRKHKIIKFNRLRGDSRGTLGGL